MKAILDNAAERGPLGAQESAMREHDAPPSRFRSILFEESGSEIRSDEPPFFPDLNLDQIVEAITAGRQEYNLKPFFYTRLTQRAEIEYRHEIMRDLENEAVFHSIKFFSEQMRATRDHLAVAEKLSFKYEKQRWFLDAVEIYCEAVGSLLAALDQSGPDSPGLLGFRGFLTHYAESLRFKALFKEAKELKAGLSAVRYCLLIRDGSVTVRDYDSEIDYSAAVEETFEGFKQGAVKDYRVKFSALSSGMNHVETQVLERVAKLNPELFRALDDYYIKNRSFLDKTIIAFDRETQFYIAWLEYADTFNRFRLKFCYPQMSDDCKAVTSRGGFDLALAGKLNRENAAVVCNDFSLTGTERIIVVTGPNQGGKTTFARTFGQLHYLASLGCPVPGTEAQLFLFDRLFTHFEREENVTTLRGKLQDDLLRIHGVIGQATPKSIIVMNEIFSSTTLQDAAFLSRRVIESMTQLDLLCVCVTFLDELSSLNEKTVSMVATMVPDNPTLRTYKIERRPADGLSYAVAIAEKYSLTYDRLKERMSSS